jgi:hypothetical protein
MKWFAVLMFGVVVAAAPAARAQDAVCTSTLQNVTIDGDVVVPVGATCTLSAVAVTGNVWVEAGAGLSVAGGTIGGDMQAYQCSYVHLHAYNPIFIAGNVLIEQCSGSSSDDNPVAFGSFSVTIVGNLICDQNFAPCSPRYSSIRGNVQVSSNSGGTSEVFGNIIGGFLACWGNTAVSATTAAPPNLPLQPNIVTGSAQGQCAGF